VNQLDERGLIADLTFNIGNGKTALAPWLVDI
jgi:hypothetical protein